MDPYRSEISLEFNKLVIIELKYARRRFILTSYKPNCHSHRRIYRKDLFNHLVSSKQWITRLSYPYYEPIWDDISKTELFSRITFFRNVWRRLFEKMFVYSPMKDWVIQTVELKNLSLDHFGCCSFTKSRRVHSVHSRKITILV